MLATAGNRFNWRATNGGAPSTTFWGTTVVSAGSTNTVGTTVECLSAATVADDVYGVLICLNNNSLAGANRNFLVNIRTDPAGGTSWTTVIPNLGGVSPGGLGAATLVQQGLGIWYYFPLAIKEGSSIGANCQCSAATQSIGVMMTVY